MGLRNAFTAVILTILFICSGLSAMQSEFKMMNHIESESTSGRNAVHEGGWAVYRELEYRTTCDEWFAYDTENDYIATTLCDYEINDGNIVIQILDNSDWDTPVATIDTDFYTLAMIDFSPNGGYLAVVDGDRFELYDTSDWSEVYADEFANDDGTYVYPYDMTWSGNDERLVFSTGSNGGKMYEGPAWSEVTGTTSNGIYVVHHPSEDILWYMSDSGAVEKYEIQDVPFVGESWVRQQMDNPESGEVGPMSISPDGGLIVAAGSGYYSYGITVYTSSSFSVEMDLNARFATFSSSGEYLLVAERYVNHAIYSTDDWSVTSEINQGIYNSNPQHFSFSSNNDEIVMLEESYYGRANLKSLKPDSDNDNVADELDACPYTPDDESSDNQGCAPSQKDTDVDGVNDRDDLCARTPSGSSVDVDGCSEQQLLDSDGDGVSDSIDVCANTPLDEFSNIYGCSSSQRDVDDDGTSDRDDVCPRSTDEDCSSVVSWIPTSESIFGTEDYSILGWSHDSTLIAAWDLDSLHIMILDAEFSLQHEIVPHDPEILFSEIQWLHDENSLVATWIKYTDDTRECGYSVYEISTINNPLHHTLDAQCDYFRSFAISPDGLEISFSIYSYTSNSNKVLSLATVSAIQLFEDANYAPYRLMYSHDGTALIGYGQGNLVVWDTNDGYLLKSVGIGSGNSVQLTPNGDWLIISTSNNDIMLFSYKTLEMVHSLTLPSLEAGRWIGSLTISRSGEYLYLMVLDRFYDGNYSYQYSIHTYQITDNNELEYKTSSLPVDEQGWGTWVAADESHVITKSSQRGGFLKWLPDTDGDLLQDEDDRCPNSPWNTTVNQDGCSDQELDDDGDGVANFEDGCPDSPIDIPTDEQGCNDQQVDEDFDGICNAGAPSNGPSNCVGEDKCPGSIPDVEIDANGCSWLQQDDDEDGVANIDDLCDNTEIASDADENGCDRKQRDSDGDSINDYWDECPATQSNSSIDAIGCSDLQVDSDLDTICNRDAISSGPSNCTAIDQCPNTGANESIDENGCSWNQRDDDADGILNKFDVCPGTMADSVAPNGCSTWQMDSDGDGVNDANDECANTDPQQIANAKGCSSEQNEVIGTSSNDEFLSSTTLVGGAGFVIVLLAALLLLRKKRDGAIDEQSRIEYPEYSTRGAMRDGREWIESPQGSDEWFYRDPSTQQWVHRK